mmetsp:Transcript_6302/g.9507  ORF Transcript_6302/g.9507 Transcript_6302/m.9507 type:complete len:210 (-) Transcript_6302:3541-4170(-)
MKKRRVKSAAMFPRPGKVRRSVLNNWFMLSVPFIKRSNRAIRKVRRIVTVNPIFDPETHKNTNPTSVPTTTRRSKRFHESVKYLCFKEDILMTASIVKIMAKIVFIVSRNRPYTSLCPKCSMPIMIVLAIMEYIMNHSNHGWKHMSKSIPAKNSSGRICFLVGRNLRAISCVLIHSCCSGVRKAKFPSTLAFILLKLSITTPTNKFKAK